MYRGGGFKSYGGVPISRLGRAHFRGRFGEGYTNLRIIDVKLLGTYSKSGQDQTYRRARTWESANPFSTLAKKGG